MPMSFSARSARSRSAGVIRSLAFPLNVRSITIASPIMASSGKCSMHIRYETLVLPPDDRLQLEVVLVLRERRRIAFLDGHGQIDDPHASRAVAAAGDRSQVAASILRLHREADTIRGAHFTT